MATAVDPSARLIHPDGFPLAIIVVSSVLFGLSVVTVALRAYTRVLKGTFGMDDGFIVAGTVMYSAATGLAIHGSLVGLGRREADLNSWQKAQGLKYYIIWILNYVVALATVKSSICITILRIASTKVKLRITVYVLLTVTWISFLITFFGTLMYCRPVEALWTPTLIISGKGSCAPVKTLVIIGHVATTSTILTDLALVVVPAIILWNAQMKKQAKLQAFGLLSFASVASIITIIRIPYVNKFEGMTNLQFWVAHTMLCSNVETGIGCIASSIPSLRHLIRHDTSQGSSGPSNKRSHPNQTKSFFTVGSQPRRGPIDAGFSLASTHRGRPVENWERLHDGSSDLSMVPLASSGERKEGFVFELNDVQNDGHKHA